MRFVHNEFTDRKKIPRIMRRTKRLTFAGLRVCGFKFYLRSPAGFNDSQKLKLLFFFTLKNRIKSPRKRFAEVPGFTTRIKRFDDLNPA